ncbi:MAG: NERD domain-containing protein [Alphaproteobacteria bacterium]|nr:NERD domain-containing protein [Alphaproteobacteria bacterium]
MKIKAFDPKGIQLAEKVGIRDVAAFPNEWYGFSNLVMRRRTRGRELREIDLVVIAHDRIIIADLKHWQGKVENRDNQWFQNDEHRGRSAVLTIEENARELKGRLEDDLATRLPAIPWVDGFVVFTHPNVDLSGLSDMDHARIMTLKEFLKLSEPREYAKVFDHSSYYTKSRQLCGNDSKLKNAITSFFSPGNVFSAAEAKFGAGYRPEQAPCFEPPSKLYAEYMAALESDANHTALLRLWDFGKLNDLASAVETRRPLAEREHSVLGYINQRAPELYDTGVLHIKDRDRDFGIRYWELFAIRRSTRRIADYILGRSEALKVRERLELVTLLLSKVAELHRIKVAHRDLAGHSVWVEHPSRVFISGFASAHFPETETLGTKRVRLLASDVRLPEDISGSGSSPFAQDVFLLGALCWTALTGKSLPEDEGVPVWLGDEFTPELGLPEGLREWFAKALEMSPEKRFADAIEMHDAFSDLRNGSGTKQDLSTELARFRTETDPYFDYPIHVPIKKGRSAVWESGSGDATHIVKVWGVARDANAAQLIAFLKKAETLKAHGITGVQRVVEFGICDQGPFLIVRKADGQPLCADVVQSWGREGALQFLTQLANVVDALHDRAIPHGDLKPDNVLVRQVDVETSPIVLDIPDFASAADGELMNAAYSPATGPADPFSRDRYAVCRIAEDVLNWLPSGVLASGDGDTLREAVAECANEEIPYLSLRALRLALSRLLTPAALQEPERVYEIMVLDLVEPEDILPDNGAFHIVVERRGRDLWLRMVGVDQELAIRVDPETLQGKDARVSDVTTKTVTWASDRRNRVGSFDGIIRAVPGRRLDLTSLDELIRGACTSEAAEAAEDVEADVDLDLEDDLQDLAGAPDAAAAEPSIPVAELWRTIIEVERSMRPEVTVAGKIVEERGGAIHLIPYEAGDREFEFDPGELVHVLRNDKKIGILDVRATTPQSLAVRDLKRGTNIQEGQALQLEANDDYASFSRRSKAVARILDNDAQIDRLAAYFDPSRRMLPVEVADAPDETVAKRYGLNEGQAKAFRELWSTGPVGLLQGPPGTGKTKFIASFVHYALTEGGMRNALVLSQSHEATNNAAEKVMELAAKSDVAIEMVRVGQESKVSERLLPHHSEAIQDRYRELFRAEMKKRVGLAARRLALPETYADDLFELEATLGDVVERILRISSGQIDEDADKDFHARRLKTLQSAYEGMLPQWIGDGHVEPEVAMRVAHDRLTDRHRIRNLEAARRLKTVMALARDWVSALSSKHRTLEDFLVRSRALVSGTCVGIGRPSLRLENVAFDLVVIDEAARCDPGELAVGMLSGKRILLVGDHKQLPPLYDLELASEVAKRLGARSRAEVTQSDFERIFRSSYGKGVGHTLNVQYRMAPAIGRLVAEEFYRDEGLETGRGEPPEWYSALPEPLDRQITWVDTAGLGANGRERKVGTSYENRAEADAIIAMLRQIARHTEFVNRLRNSLKEGEKGIGIICMYGAQKRLVRDRITATPWPEGFEDLIKVDTVDGYQGKENPIVIVSITRNNQKGRIGHVESFQRMNVALSRAMERLVIVGATTPFERDWEGNSLKGVLVRIRGGEDGHAHIYPAERLQEA